MRSKQTGMTSGLRYSHPSTFALVAVSVPMVGGVAAAGAPGERRAVSGPAAALGGAARPDRKDRGRAQHHRRLPRCGAEHGLRHTDPHRRRLPRRRTGGAGRKRLWLRLGRRRAHRDELPRRGRRANAPRDLPKSEDVRWTLVGVEPRKDIAVIKVDAPPRRPLRAVTPPRKLLSDRLRDRAEDNAASAHGESAGCPTSRERLLGVATR